jgi:PEP-CTERM motif
MKRFVSAAAIALIAGMGAASAARSATINFAVSVLGGANLGYTGGARLDLASAFDFDGASLLVSAVGSGDQSGLSPFPVLPDTVTLDPSLIAFGAGTGSSTLPTDVVKGWTGGNGDVFTETLTNVQSINRATPNAITVFLTGTVSDTLGLFNNTPVNFILSANQVGGAGTAIEAGFTNTTVLGSIPEPSTWVMFALGFAGLGYTAIRRSAKDRPALPV